MIMLLQWRIGGQLGTDAAMYLRYLLLLDGYYVEGQGFQNRESSTDHRFLPEDS